MYLYPETGPRAQVCMRVSGMCPCVCLRVRLCVCSVHVCMSSGVPTCMHVCVLVCPCVCLCVNSVHVCVCTHKTTFQQETAS